MKFPDRYLYATAAAYARLCELTEYLEGQDPKGNLRGAVDARGRPRGCMPLFISLYRAVMTGLRELGAMPTGRAEMAGGVVAAQGLAGQLARRREELERERHGP
jgi:hypothetical protein